MVMHGSTQTGIPIRYESLCRIGKSPFGNSQFKFKIADKQIPTDKNLMSLLLQNEQQIPNNQ